MSEEASQVPDLVVTADRVLAGRSRHVVADGAVHVRDGRIAAVGPECEVVRRASSDTVVLRFPGATMLPGLIDCHVHLAFDAGRDPASVLRQQDDTALLLAMATRARTLLDSGVTTVRDLGDRGGLTIGLRDLIAEGQLPGPRLLAAATPLTSQGGHCWFLGGEVVGPDGIRALVARNAAAGADLIKVMATGGHLTPGGPAMWQSQFTEDELRLVVSEAAGAGLRVAAHAHGTKGIADAVTAGVYTIEHCTWLGDGAFDVPARLVDEIAARGIHVSPAISRNWRGFPQRFGQDAADQLLGRLRWLDERGVSLIAGTDAGVPGATFDSFVDAMAAYRHAGFGNDRIIELATTAAAAALGLGDTTGHLTVGADADILVVRGDPRTDLDALRDVQLTVARGRPHVPGSSPASVRPDETPSGRGGK